ncbi:hypothetical protein BV898_09199 [Hypsibius exemplaris]|uniref:WAP domain-containing protein n=1 Tax=Hypsibius exemplaris TaxID=2072580 RepID=A0A1W0WNA8_HYPEX|nr:hypothetical protein BV898_09199 [Hypsibius exemplaris]
MDNLLTQTVIFAVGVIILGPFGSSAAQESAPRACFPSISPDNPGYCILRNHVSRKCRGLLSSFSTDCLGKEVCCFDPAVTVATPEPTTTAPVTTTDSTPPPTTEVPVRYCVPDSGPPVPDGVCRAKSDIAAACLGLALSTSQNCLHEEVCCYNPPATTTTTTTERPTERRTTTTTTEAPTNPPTTLPTVVRTCRPGSYAAITNGVCTSSKLIFQQCKGKQISPSVDCLRKEYCCFYADSPVGAGFYQAGLSCSPDSNPMIGSGTCVDSYRSGDMCETMLWGRSRNCDRNQVCCYPVAAAGLATTRRKLVLTTATTSTDATASNGGGSTTASTLAQLVYTVYPLSFTQ